MITLLTCTGGRPDAWALCQKYIARQTLREPTQWVVVYDTEEVPVLLNLPPHIKVEMYKGPKPWRQGINTQRPNMDEALKYVKGDVIFTIEDDDCYAPNYIEMMIFFLQKFDVVGQANSRYYNIKERQYKEWNNYRHCSLNETALKKSKLDLLDRAVNSGNMYFDIALWEIVRNEKHSHLIFSHLGLVTGMKGLPGKAGIGGGHHDLKEQGFKADSLFEKLREWVGPDSAKEYAALAQKGAQVKP